MNDRKWWQKAIFYQIYPRSFADSTGDGVGDLPGITEKLYYLKDLGIGAIWLSPHYPSPQVDCGYDITDYQCVGQEYGKLEDFQTFLFEAHKRNIHVVLDMVLNHTSDRHPFFLESKSSKNNPKRDWYIWKNGKGNEPPNNWFSTFGGSAWEMDSTTGEYYYHFFFKEQPDLNWRNPEVKEAMFDAMRFWLDMGVDGFRLDAIGTIFEDPNLPDHKARFNVEDYYKICRLANTETKRRALPAQWDEMFHYQHDQPGIHDLMRELRALTDEYEDRVLIGETDDLSFYGNGRDELHMVFNFPLMNSPYLTPEGIIQNQNDRIAKIPKEAWAANTLGNHDTPRMFSRYGDGQHDDALARLHLAMLLTLKGTPFLYNGEEIGMSDFLIDDPTLFRDRLGTRAYHLEMQLMGTPSKEAALFAAREGRDKCRTPMQWDGSANAGFCPQRVTPWLPVNPNYTQGVNIQKEDGLKSSLLNFYKQIMRVRNATPELIEGEYKLLDGENPEILAFERYIKKKKCLVVLNFADHIVVITEDAFPNRIQVKFCSSPTLNRTIDGKHFSIPAFGVLVGEKD